MKTGCLLALLLLPITILIWAKKELRRRDAMPPEKRKELEDKEAYGPIDPKLSCTFCHAEKCVRVKKITRATGEASQIFCEKNLRDSRWHLFPENRIGHMVRNELYHRTDFILAQCMECDAHWELYDPEGKNNE